MKILPSSPYAVFNVKEWESVLDSRKKFNKNSKCILQKYYYKNFKKYNLKSSVRNEIKKTKLIQLSFAWLKDFNLILNYVSNIIINPMVC